jgi:hypothetical protein
MSKIHKLHENEPKLKREHRSDERFAYRSVIVSAILGGICYIISLFFNIGVVTVFMNIDLIWTIIDILIKVVVILLFFLFMIISISNYKELIGKPLNWRELSLLFLLSIGQTLLNVWVLVLTIFGLGVILIYLYIIQEL